MTSHRRASVVFFGIALLAATYACVGDSPDTATAPEADSGTNDGSPGADGGGTATDGGDAGNGAACDGGLVCDGVCTDVTTSAKHCGRCEHDCGAGDCKAGICQAKLVAGDTDAGTTSSISAVATDEPADDPQALSAHVFWASTDTAGTGGVYQDSVLGGNTLKVSLSPPQGSSSLAVHGTDVFWSTYNFGGGIAAILKGQVGVANTQTGYGFLGANPFVAFTHDPTTKLVVATYPSGTTNYAIAKCGPTLADGGVECTNAGTFAGVVEGNVAKGGDHFYFCVAGAGTIVTAPFAAPGNTSLYAQSQATPNLVRVAGNNLFWSNSGTKTIWRAAKGATATGAMQVASTTHAADAIAADDVNVYFTDSVTGILSYAPITGAGPNTPYVDLGPSAKPMRLVRDTGFLYFSHNGAIYRVALP